MLLDTGCSDYELKYELFTRNEIGAGAKYFQDYTKSVGIDTAPLSKKIGFEEMIRVLAQAGYEIRKTNLDAGG